LPEKQVIFVGGTSYSGSTMLDMMLANGPGGFSCGELVASFVPYRKHHLSPSDESAGGSDFPWQSVIASGPDNVYDAIFAADSRITRIIDSSKDPFWISSRMQELSSRGIRSRSLLIWKTPAEFMQSRKKRDRERGWRRAWINYHKLYFSLVPDWRSVAYRPLVTDPGVLEAACRYLDIEYFPDKQKFWEGSYETLFGNSRAKIHLYDQDSDRYKGFDREVAGLQEKEVEGRAAHRNIYYEAPDRGIDEELLTPLMSKIIAILEQRAAGRNLPDDSDAVEIPPLLRASALSVATRRWKKRLYSDVFRAIRGR
jgi:hypothetical protein